MSSVHNAEFLLCIARRQHKRKVLNCK